MLIYHLKRYAHRENTGIESRHEVMCNGNALLSLHFLKVLKHILETIFCQVRFKCCKKFDFYL